MPKNTCKLDQATNLWMSLASARDAQPRANVPSQGFDVSTETNEWRYDSKVFTVGINLGILEYFTNLNS